MADDNLAPGDAALKWISNVYGQATEIGLLVQPLITMPDPDNPERIFVEVATVDKKRYRLVFSKLAYNAIATGKPYL